MSKLSKYRNFCFTSFKEERPTFDEDAMTYMICQKEICPSSKKEHWQGYVEFKTQKRITEAKSKLKDDSVHLECRHGTQEQAIDYCRKSATSVKDTVIEYGIPKRQGNRSDLDSIFDMVESGATTKEILIEFKGHGMRYISHICKTLEVYHRDSEIDKIILAKRYLNASQVVGNTEPQQILMIEDNKIIKKNIESRYVNNEIMLSRCLNGEA